MRDGKALCFKTRKRASQVPRKASLTEEHHLKNHLSVNKLAWCLLEKLVEKSVLYKVKVKMTSQGTTMVDAGIEAEGGFQAGRLITEICLGGLGKARLYCRKYDDLSLQSIFVRTNHPVVAALGSQFAGWRLSDEGYSAMGSGPARALALKPKELYDEIRYKDESDKAVVVLETEKSPPLRLIDRIAEDCNIQAAKLAVILTPTTSSAGSTQIAGRIVETGLHKLRQLGLDPMKVQSAWGYAPIAPVHPKFARAMGRTNDAILYGGTASYTVDYGDDEKLKKIVENAPSSASSAYGKTFCDIFKDAGYDFYKIDPNLFAPATIIINNVRTDKRFKNGRVNVQMLKKSFDLTSK
jgi:methenyltetrahydromethanopterin cyclohydrolase